MSLEQAATALAEGDVDAARRSLSKITPAALSAEDAARYVLLLVECGDLAHARVAAHELGLDDLLERTVGPGDDDPAEDEEEAPLDLRSPRPAATDAAAAELLKFFGGRRDVYAKQWFDETRRRQGYHPVEQPLTLDVARAHLEGRITVGQYLLSHDGLAAFGVLDLDLSASALAEWRAMRGEDASTLEHPSLRAYATSLRENALRLGLELFAEDSGNRGLHLWLLLSPPRPARAVRSLLSQVVVAAGPQPPDLSVELFPKQDSVGPRGLSSLVKLPLGVHRVTLRRCPLLDDRLEPIDDPLVALSRLRIAPPDLVDAVLARRLVPLPPPGHDEPLAAPPPLPRVASPRALAEALRAVPADDAAEACVRMLDGCAVLREVTARAYERHQLDADSARAIAYTLGLVGPVPALAREVLAVANASTKELDRVRRGLPSPTGCNRLARLALPGTCDGCRRGDVPYATPALFATGATAPSAPRSAPFAPWLDPEQPLETLAEDPLAAVSRALASIEARLARLEPPPRPEPPPKKDR